MRGEEGVEKLASEIDWVFYCFDELVEEDVLVRFRPRLWILAASDGFADLAIDWWVSR